MSACLPLAVWSGENAPVVPVVEAVLSRPHGSLGTPLASAEAMVSAGANDPFLRKDVQAQGLCAS